MRLGDLDALKEKLKNRYEVEQDEIDKGWNLGIGVAINLTETAPTFEPKLEEINEKLINEYISKVRCCDECFASVYCTVNGLRESRVPQDYCVKNIKKYFSYEAKLVEERPQCECENCDFRKFTERFIDGVIDLMNQYGITSFDQLSEKLKGGDGE